MTPHPTLQAADRELDHAERWISISRYALVYGVSRPTVYKWLEAGALDYWRLERVIRIRPMPPRCDCKAL